MTDILTEIRFWAQVMTDAQRTVICSPNLESRCKGWVDARGLGGLITVIPSPACPDDRVLIIDERALEGYMNQVMSQPFKFMGWK